MSLQTIKRHMAKQILLQAPDISNRGVVRELLVQYGDTLDHKTIGEIRKELVAAEEIPLITKRKGKDGIWREFNRKRAIDDALQPLYGVTGVYVLLGFGPFDQLADKIGSATNTATRIKHILNLSPLTIPVAVIPMDGIKKARCIERELHKYFADDLIPDQKEWFWHSPKLSRFYDELRENTDVIFDPLPNSRLMEVLDSLG